MTCYIEHSDIVEFKNNQLSVNKDEEVTGLSMAWNKNLISLPENLNEIFPQLTAFDADCCNVQKVSKKNFAGLKKLKNLKLNSNPIEEIYDDTFEDLTSLEYLHLSKCHKSTYCSGGFYFLNREPDLRKLNCVFF